MNLVILKEFKFSFFNKSLVRSTFIGFLWRDRWNIEPRISGEKKIFELQKLAISSENVNSTKTVLTFDMISYMLRSASASHFGRYDFHFHEAIIAFNRVQSYFLNMHQIFVVQSDKKK